MRGVCVGVSSLLVLAPQPAALAAAWTLPQGKGVVVVTGTASRASEAFDGDGKPQPAAVYRKLEAQAMLEYGVSDWLTAIAAPGLQRVDIGAPTNAHRSGLGTGEFGARARLAEWDAWVFAGQATLRVPGTSDAANPAAIGYTGTEFDLRALAGVSFTAAGAPAFMDFQLAQRFRGGGPPDEFRADATFGIRPVPRWLLMAQSFNVFSEGASPPTFPSYRYHKLQASAVYELTEHWALQGGFFTTIAGRNALLEHGALLGAWYRF